MVQGTSSRHFWECRRPGVGGRRDSLLAGVAIAKCSDLTPSPFLAPRYSNRASQVLLTVYLPKMEDVRLSLWLHYNGRLFSLQRVFSSESSLDGARCCVCLENPCVHMLLPCRHLCLCAGCALCITTCPVCRTAVISLLRTPEKEQSHCSVVS